MRVAYLFVQSLHARASKGLHRVQSRRFGGAAHARAQSNRFMGFSKFSHFDRRRRSVHRRRLIHRHQINPGDFVSIRWLVIAPTKRLLDAQRFVFLSFCIQSLPRRRAKRHTLLDVIRRVNHRVALFPDIVAVIDQDVRARRRAIDAYSDIHRGWTLS